MVPATLNGQYLKLLNQYQQGKFMLETISNTNYFQGKENQRILRHISVIVFQQTLMGQAKRAEKDVAQGESEGFRRSRRT